MRSPLSPPSGAAVQTVVSAATGLITSRCVPLGTGPSTDSAEESAKTRSPSPLPVNESSPVPSATVMAAPAWSSDSSTTASLPGPASSPARRWHRVTAAGRRSERQTDRVVTTQRVELRPPQWRHRHHVVTLGPRRDRRRGHHRDRLAEAGRRRRTQLGLRRCRHEHRGRGDDRHHGNKKASRQGEPARRSHQYLTIVVEPRPETRSCRYDATNDPGVQPDTILFRQRRRGLDSWRSPGGRMCADVPDPPPRRPAHDWCRAHHFPHDEW